MAWIHSFVHGREDVATPYKRGIDFMSSNRTVGILPAAISIYLILMLTAAGCQINTPQGGLLAGDQPAFQVSKVRLLPSFTKFKPADPGKDQPASIEAYVELNDQFGDALKALGQFRFELFEYRPAFSDPRGKRFADKGLQLIDLTKVQTNQQHWDSITRSYHLNVNLPAEAVGLKQLVLQVTFITESDYRLRDILILAR